jgi:hypothetical protein
MLARQKMQRIFQDIVAEFLTLTPAHCHDPAFSRKAARERLRDTVRPIVFIDVATDFTSFDNGTFIGRNCDILLSTLVETDDDLPVETTVFTGGLYVDKYVAQPRQFRLGIAQGQMIPCITCTHHSTYLRFSRPIKRLYSVCAMLPPEERKFMAHTSTLYFVHDVLETSLSQQSCDDLDQELDPHRLGVLTCHRGCVFMEAAVMRHDIPNIRYMYPSILRMICYGDEAFDRANMTEKQLFPMTLPDHFALDDRLSTAAIRRRLSGYREELMQVTWHPNRFMDWCLSIEDENRDQEVRDKD